MRAHESYNFSSPTAADSAVFDLLGGAYVFDAVAAWGGGSATLKRLGPDGQTYITAATALSADGTSGSLALPPGKYKIVVVTAAAISVSVIRIPAE